MPSESAPKNAAVTVVVQAHVVINDGEAHDHPAVSVLLSWPLVVEDWDGVLGDHKRYEQLHDAMEASALDRLRPYLNNHAHFYAETVVIG